MRVSRLALGVIVVASLLVVPLAALPQPSPKGLSVLVRADNVIQ